MVLQNLSLLELDRFLSSLTWSVTLNIYSNLYKPQLFHLLDKNHVYVIVFS